MIKGMVSLRNAHFFFKKEGLAVYENLVDRFS